MKDINLDDLIELSKQLGDTPSMWLKKEVFSKFFPDVENVRDWKLVLPKSYQDKINVEFDWIVYDIHTDKPIAFNTFGLIELRCNAPKNKIVITNPPEGNNLFYRHWMKNER